MGFKVRRENLKRFQVRKVTKVPPVREVITASWVLRAYRAYKEPRVLKACHLLIPNPVQQDTREILDRQLATKVTKV